MRRNDPEPAPLEHLITSRLSAASTVTTEPKTACKLYNGRSQPVRSARPSHQRGREGMRPDLLNVCRELARGERPWPLYLWSPGPGTGKTSAALTLLDHHGPTVRPGFYSPDVHDFMAGFADFAGLPALFRAAEKGHHYLSTPTGCEPVWDSQLWALVKRAELLVLDDLRRPGDREQRLGDDHYGILKRILDERVGRGLVITSNLSPVAPNDEIPELVRYFDDRVADRIVWGTVFKLGGTTRRAD